MAGLLAEAIKPKSEELSEVSAATQTRALEKQISASKFKKVTTKKCHKEVSFRLGRTKQSNPGSGI